MNFQGIKTALSKFIKDIVTTTDGSSYDITHFLGILAFVTYLAMAIYTVVIQGHALDYVSFGTGLGAVVTSIGAALRLNPENNKNSPMPAPPQPPLPQ